MTESEAGNNLTCPTCGATIRPGQLHSGAARGVTCAPLFHVVREPLDLEGEDWGRQLLYGMVSIPESTRPRGRKVTGRLEYSEERGCWVEVPR
jgi:hypothetical protein